VQIAIVARVHETPETFRCDRRVDSVLLNRRKSKSLRVVLVIRLLAVNNRSVKGIIISLSVMRESQEARSCAINGHLHIRDA